MHFVCEKDMNLGGSGAECYRMTVSSQIYMLKSNPQFDGIWRLDLFVNGEAMRSHEWD